MTVKAVRIYDKEKITEVMTSPEIWATVAEDGQYQSDFEPDVEGECWLAMIADGEVVGVYNIHAINSITAEIHAHVLPAHRVEHSFRTGAEALRWIYFEAPMYKKIVARIPRIYDNVKRFTCGFGFQVEGICRASYRKNGEIVDRWMLGITRDEIGEFLDEQGC